LYDTYPKNIDFQRELVVGTIDLVAARSVLRGLCCGGIYLRLCLANVNVFMCVCAVTGKTETMVHKKYNCSSKQVNN